MAEQPGRAYPRLLQAFEAFPLAGFLTVDLADAALGCGEVDVAARFLQRAGEEPRRKLKALTRTWARIEADLLAAQGERFDARRLYEWLRKKHRAPSLRLHYGRFLVQEGDLAEAVRVFHELVQHRPEIATYREELAATAAAWWRSLLPRDRLARAVQFLGGDSVPERDVFWIMLEQSAAPRPAAAREYSIILHPTPSPDLQRTTPEDLRRILEVMDMMPKLPKKLRKLLVLESLFPEVKPVSKGLRLLLQGCAHTPSPVGTLALLVTATVMAFLVPPTAPAQDEIFSWEGETAGDWFGLRLAKAGDVDNDGVSDVIIGSANAASGRGKAYVYSGADGRLIWAIPGEDPNDMFGISVSAAGDVDADGYFDFVVGAERHVEAGVQGKVYLYSGLTGNLLWSRLGEGNPSLFGQAVSGGKDFNGDGIPDVVVGAYWYHSLRGKLCVYSGNTGDLLWSQEGQAVGDGLGLSVAINGDVNGDGLGDVVAGAPWVSTGGKTECGRTYVFSGPAGTPFCTRDGEDAGDRFGYRLGYTGDVDQDGFDDIVATAPWASSRRGKVYVFSCSQVIFQWQGEQQDPVSGLYWAAGAGDVNGDGYPDLIAGNHYYDGGAGADSGRAYLHSGIHGRLLWVWDGEATGDYFGVPVHAAGDLGTPDGLADILLGAFGHDGFAGTDSGKAYVFAGNDLFLQAEARTVSRGTPITLHARGGRPGVRAVLLLVATNGGNPTYQLLSTGALDANGEWDVTLPVPSPLGTTTLTFQSFYSMGTTAGGITDSNQETVTIQ